MHEIKNRGAVDPRPWIRAAADLAQQSDAYAACLRCAKSIYWLTVRRTSRWTLRQQIKCLCVIGFVTRSCVANRLENVVCLRQCVKQRVIRPAACRACYWVASTMTKLTSSRERVASLSACPVMDTGNICQSPSAGNTRLRLIGSRCPISTSAAHTQLALALTARTWHTTVFSNCETAACCHTDWLDTLSCRHKLMALHSLMNQDEVLKP